MDLFLHFAPELMAEHGVSQKLRLASLIKASVALPESDDPEEVSRYLQRCQATVTQQLVADAGVYSKAQWLAYLRRTPDFIFGDKTLGYHRNLAEAITGIGGAKKSASEPDFDVYPFDRSVADVTIKLAAGINYLAMVLWLLRASSRGVALTLTADSELPTECDPAPYAEAFGMYLRRHRNSGGTFWTRAGTEFLLHTADQENPHSIMLVSRINPRVTHVERRDDPGKPADTVLQSYALFLADVSKVLSFATPIPNGVRWPSREFWLLALTLRLAARMCSRNREMWLSSLAFGYVSIERDWLSEVAQSWWEPTVKEVLRQGDEFTPPSTADDLFSALNDFKPSVWPLAPEPIFRLDGNLALWDLQGATGAVERSLSFTAETGNVANVRAGHFEAAIQEAIDSSPWAPPANVHQLQGKPLRVGGKPITNVDAIAANGPRLLLISAKSILFTSEHDSGSYRAVRNATSTVPAACEDAKRHLSILRANPKGDNYDFSTFSELEIVVCVPYVVYVPIGPATELIWEKLRAAVSLTELKEFTAS